MLGKENELLLEHDIKIKNEIYMYYASYQLLKCWSVWIKEFAPQTQKCTKFMKIYILSNAYIYDM